MKRNLLLGIVALSSLLFVGCSINRVHEQGQNAATESADSTQEQIDLLSSEIQDLREKNMKLSEENEALKDENEKISKDLLTQNNGDDSTTDQGTNASSENWKNTPARIKKLYTKDSKTYLSIDILSHNPDFMPGVTEFFINQSKKLREIQLGDSAKFYKCEPGVDNNPTTADVAYSIQEFIKEVNRILPKNSEVVIYYFDISDSVITSVYEQCLP